MSAFFAAEEVGVSDDGGSSDEADSDGTVGSLAQFVVDESQCESGSDAQDARGAFGDSDGHQKFSRKRKRSSMSAPTPVAAPAPASVAASVAAAPAPASAPAFVAAALAAPELRHDIVSLRPARGGEEAFRRVCWTGVLGDVIRNGQQVEVVEEEGRDAWGPGEQDPVAPMEEGEEKLPEEEAHFAGMPHLRAYHHRIITPAEDMTFMELAVCLSELSGKYLGLDTEALDKGSVYAAVGFSPGVFVTHDMLAVRRRELNLMVFALFHRFRNFGIIRKNEAGSIIEGKFRRVLRSIQALCNLVSNMQLALMAVNTNVATQGGLLNDMSDLEEVSALADRPLVALVTYMLGITAQCGYRKHGDQVFQEIQFEHEGVAYNTHAWAPIAEMQDFIYMNTRKCDVYEQWLHTLSSGGIVATAAERLAHSYDAEFPRLVTDRRVWSFTNGIYFGDDNVFKSYADIAAGTTSIRADVVSSKFFELPFVDYSAPGALPPGSYWWDIPTPILDKMLQAQRLGAPGDDLSIERGDPRYNHEEEVEVMHWIYALLGRLMYKVGERDNWQVLPFIKGCAGTGKSTLAMLMQKLYLKSDVAVMSNNIEKKFGLSAVYGKNIYLCFEVKHDFGLDQAEFQSVVSGEYVSIAEKHKTARTVKWESHGLFAGNVFPSSYMDNAGSISRRLVIIFFNVPILCADTALLDRLDGELPALIQKLNCAYLHKVAQYGETGLWTPGVLPEHFHRTQQKMLAETHQLRHFLEFGMKELFVFKSDGYVLFSEFKSRYEQADRGLHTRGLTFNAEYYGPPFHAYGLRVTPDAEMRSVEGTPRLALWIDGIARIGGSSGSGSSGGGSGGGARW